MEGNRVKVKQRGFKLDKRKDFLTIRFLKPGMVIRTGYGLVLSRDL